MFKFLNDTHKLYTLMGFLCCVLIHVFILQCSNEDRKICVHAEKIFNPPILSFKCIQCVIAIYSYLTGTSGILFSFLLEVCVCFFVCLPACLR